MVAGTGELVTQAQELGESTDAKLRYEKGDHPRLWVSNGRLAKIAERCAPGGCMNAEYVALKNKVDSELASGKTYLSGAKIVAVGLCYLVEKHHGRNVEPYFRGLKSVIGIDNPQLDGGRVWQYATAVDWIWNDLTAEERTAAAKWLMGDGIHQAWRYRRPTEEPRGRNWYRDDSIAVTHTALTNIVFWDEDIEEETIHHSVQWLDKYFEDYWKPLWDTIETFPEGWHYFLGRHRGCHPYFPLAWDEATGRFPNLVKARLLANLPRTALLAQTPWSDALTDYGDWSFTDGIGVFIHPVYCAAATDGYAPFIVKKWNDGYFQNGGFTHWDWTSAALYILFYDPEKPHAEPGKDLPLAHLDAGRGIVYMHEKWGDPEAVLATYRAGPYITGHQHCEAGHFMIYGRGGQLAVEAGARLAGYSDGHLHFRTSLAHNTLSIHDPSENVGGPREGHQPIPHGGQNMHVNKHLSFEKIIKMREELEPIADVGRIKAYEATEHYTYVDSVLTNAYRGDLFHSNSVRRGENKARASLVTRQFLYLRPDVFVIFDRVHATDASFTKDWILHTWNDPQVSGRQVAADLNAHGGGWAEYDGDTVSFVGCQKLGVQAGKMFVKALLPEKRIIRKRGGPDKNGNHWTKESFEFWMSPGRAGDRHNRVGKNGCPPTLENAGGQSHLRTLSREHPESEHHSKWRIEIEPTEERKDALFLIVLYVCDKNTSEIPKTELLRRDGMVGVKIAGKTRIWEVLFSEEDRRGGKIKIADSTGAKCVLDSNLGNDVQYRIDRSLDLIIGGGL
jgi:hypothetical protein